MNVVNFIYTFLLLASILCATLLIIYSYRRRNMPGANYFILLLFTAIIYNGAYIGEINSQVFSRAMFWFDVEHVAIPIQHYFWIMMSLEYVQIQKKKLNKAKYVLLYHPIIYYLIYFTNNIHNQYISHYNFESNGYFFVIGSTKEALFILMVVSGTVLGIISTTFYIRGYMKSPRLQRNGYLVMVIASLFPWIAVYLNTTNSSFLGIDYFPVATIISGFLFVYGIFRFRTFNAIPIAMETIFRQAREGMLLVDLTDHIIDVNNSFLNIFPESGKLSNEYTLDSFIKNYPELEGILNGKDKFEFTINGSGNIRYYCAEISKILLENELQIGKIVTITDITVFTEDQKKLQAIASNAMDKAETNEMFFLQAQISPHFINNTLSVIASMITRAPNEAKIMITDLGDYLANCCYFDTGTDMIPLKKELETVNTYVNIEKARFRERVNFQLVCDEIPTIYIPRLILQPLVENAIRHGILKKVDGGKVLLLINQNQETDKIWFEIRDDGVGISEDKLKALTIEDDNKQSIGIININKRLQKYYKEGVIICSTVDKGTSVKFAIPLDKQIYTRGH